MSGVGIERVWDFASYEVDAAIRCGGCGRTWRITSEELAAAVGRDATIAAAQRQLACRECGHTGVKLGAVPRMQD
jgi:DNA-directed RNA polymerase subunit RPC12/RpoP